MRPSSTVGTFEPEGTGKPRTICQKSGASALPSQSARFWSITDWVMRNGNFFASSGDFSAGDFSPS